MKKNQSNAVYLFLGLLGLMLAWAVAASAVDNSLVIPSVGAVFSELIKALSEAGTYLIILNTVSRLLLVIAICFILAFVLAILSFLFKPVEYVLKPLFVTLRTLPIVAVIIVLLLMFGNASSPLFVTGFVVFPILYEMFLLSFRVIDPNIKDEIRMVGGNNFYGIRKIYLPLSFSHALAALVQSLGLGLKVMVMAEYIAQPKDTIGYAMVQGIISLDTANVFAWAILLIVLVIISEILIKKIKISTE
ncbi:MAG TPA: hypothetical protein DD618_04900 [Acholeplasmatales bacterium]|nr:hypothetical protein [Acholeplasmatales bacterium]